MMYESLGKMAGAVLFSVAAVISQALTLELVERFVGGSVVVAAAVTVTFFTIKYSERQQGAWSALLKAERERADHEAERRIRAENQCDEWRSLYDIERAKRMELETGR